MTKSEEIRAILGISRAEFGRRYNIPIRTLEDWDSGKSKPPAYVAELLERVVKEDKEMADRLWYAVQRDREDDWGTGSFDKDEAIEMLKNQGCGLIAVIQNDTCIEEIEYEDIKDKAMIKEYGVIPEEINQFSKRLQDDTEEYHNFEYDTMFRTQDKEELMEYIGTHRLDDSNCTIECYTVDEDGEFIEGSDYDTPSNFKKKY